MKLVATSQESLVELVRARDLAKAQAIVKSLETKQGFRWRAVGDNDSNYGVINIGSDPGLALVERVTNAIDAVIEREAERQRRNGKVKFHYSPREAVEKWLKVPAGRLVNLNITQRQALADDVVVSLYSGSVKRRPTVGIRDFGIGLTASEIPRTILSLNAGNKLSKQYLAGAYGQGGSTTLPYSPDGTMVVSRKQPEFLADGDRDLVAVTLARFNPLDVEINKTGRYEFLVGPEDEVAAVPTAKLKEFEPGTSVIHFDMQITRYAARMTQLTGSIWWLLQNALFDPVLPFWAEEARPGELKKKGKTERRTIVGNFTRLSTDAHDKIEHRDTIDVSVPHETGDTLVKVHYWVLRESEDSSTPPISSYVDLYHPVAYTFFGQTQGNDDRRFVSERLFLPYLAKYLIIQIELEHITPHARREILSTTRDRLKMTEFYFALRECVCKALSEDEDLVRINDERKDRILSKHSEKERDRLRERFARLMEQHRAGIDAKVGGKEGGTAGRDKKPTPESRKPLDPLPTRKTPTFLRIVNAQQPVPIRTDRHALLRLESDAPDGYLTSHVHARLTLVSEPKAVVKLESSSDFRGGRARVTIRVDGAHAGQTGSVTVFLFTAEGSEVRDSVTFRVEDPPKPTSSGGSGRSSVKTPEPIPVHRDEWPEFQWDSSSVAEVREDSESTKVYVNMDNQHLIKLTHSSRYAERGVKRMQNGFLLYAAFYAWLQFSEMRGKDLALEGEEFDKYRMGELDRMAQTVVHSISAESNKADEDEE